MHVTEHSQPSTELMLVTDNYWLLLVGTDNTAENVLFTFLVTFKTISIKTEDIILPVLLVFNHVIPLETVEIQLVRWWLSSPLCLMADIVSSPTALKCERVCFYQLKLCDKIKCSPENILIIGRLFSWTDKYHNCSLDFSRLWILSCKAIDVQKNV